MPHNTVPWDHRPRAGRSLRDTDAMIIDRANERPGTGALGWQAYVLLANYDNSHGPSFILSSNARRPGGTLSDIGSAVVRASCAVVQSSVTRCHQHSGVDISQVDPQNRRERWHVGEKARIANRVHPRSKSPETIKGKRRDRAEPLVSAARISAALFLCHVVSFVERCQPHTALRRCWADGLGWLLFNGR
jgi:hypothetical protein